MKTNINFFIISHSFLLKMRNVSLIVVEKRKIRILYSVTFLSRVLPFMR